MTIMARRFYLKELSLVAALLTLLLNEKTIESAAYRMLGSQPTTVEWAPLTALFASHLLLVLSSLGIAILLALLSSFLIHLLKMEVLEDLFVRIAAFGTAFPSVAIIALLVPTLGYGFKPVFIALILYSFLPIFLSTTEGLRSVDVSVRAAAVSCGLSEFQILRQIEIPLAKNMILAGIKTALILNIATATLGSVVGVNSLGLPIVLGIRTNNLILILKGSLPVALLALIVESIFSRWEGKQKWQIS